MGDLLEANAGPRRLRELLEGPEPVIAPGAYDALSARLVEEAGFAAVYMTGFGASASLLGRPDVGLLAAGEMADHARRLVDAVAVPVVADADDGYGNPLNVARTVRAYEAAGVAALHLEDQVAPKRCGHLEGKAVIPTAEMVEKVHAAVEARRFGQVVIIARTDANAVEGLDAALERARAYRDAGADAIFVESPETEREVEEIAAALSDVPLVFNWLEGAKSPSLELGRLRDLGFALVLCPLTALLAATAAVRGALARVREDGTPVGVLEDLPSFAELTDAVGLPEVSRLEERFAVAQDA